MAEKKANKTIKTCNLQPAKQAQRSFPIVVQQDPRLSERIDAARELNIVPGLNFFWD